MTKILEIEQCADCPHCDYRYLRRDSYVLENYCQETLDTIPDTGRIPRWCPLDDAPDELGGECSHIGCTNPVRLMPPDTRWRYCDYHRRVL